MWVLSLSLLLSGLCNYSSGCPTCPDTTAAGPNTTRLSVRPHLYNPPDCKGWSGVEDQDPWVLILEYRAARLCCWSRPPRLITTSIMESVNVWWGRLVLGKDGEQLWIILERKKETFKSGLAHEFSTGLLKCLIFDAFIWVINALYFRSSQYTFFSPCV